MKLAIVAAEFTDEEANGLRRAMATFRNVGTIDQFEEMMVERMVARGYERDFAAALLQADQGLRQLRLSRKPCRVLRPAGLCLGLDQMPSSGGLRLRAAEFAADGLLRPGADRARRAGAWRRGPRRRCQPQRLGQHAGARSRTARSPCVSAFARSTASGRRSAAARRAARQGLCAASRTLRGRRAAAGADAARAGRCRCLPLDGPRPARGAVGGAAPARRRSAAAVRRSRRRASSPTRPMPTCP